MVYGIQKGGTGGGAYTAQVVQKHCISFDNAGEGRAKQNDGFVDEYFKSERISCKGVRVNPRGENILRNIVGNKGELGGGIAQ